MKKFIALFLCLTFIFSLTACKSTKDTSLSNTSDFTSEIIYTTNDNESTLSEEKEESSIPADVSSEETVTQNSSDTGTSSTTPTPSIPTSSMQQTTSSEIITTEPQTYFDKMGLKITPLTNDICFNDDPNHVCPYDKQLAIEEKNMSEYSYMLELFDEDFFGDSFDVTKYKKVSYTVRANYTYEWRPCGVSDAIIFDRYTGTILYFGNLGNNDWSKWQEIPFNNKKIYVNFLNGFGAGGSDAELVCPVDYDGAVFAIVKELHTEINETIKTIDEVIDFKNDEYYLFSASGK